MAIRHNSDNNLYPGSVSFKMLKNTSRNTSQAVSMSRSEVGGEPVRMTCESVPTSGKF